jgi:uncharacterized protein YqfA (UPF0365 family)
MQIIMNKKEVTNPIMRLVLGCIAMVLMIVFAVIVLFVFLPIMGITLAITLGVVLAIIAGVLLFLQLFKINKPNSPLLKNKHYSSKMPINKNKKKELVK